MLLKEAVDGDLKSITTTFKRKYSLGSGKNKVNLEETLTEIFIMADLKRKRLVYQEMNKDKNGALVTTKDEDYDLNKCKFTTVLGIQYRIICSDGIKEILTIPNADEEKRNKVKAFVEMVSPTTPVPPTSPIPPTDKKHRRHKYLKK
jgi:hypothetical protein